MKKVTIFGKSFEVIENRSEEDSVMIDGNKIIVNVHRRMSKSLLDQFMFELLQSELLKIYERIKANKKVEILGDIEFKIVNSIDGKKNRIAKIKGNKIFIKQDAVSLPKSALKYIIAHELGHAVSKKHTEKFWKVVESIYPNYRKGEELLKKYGEIVLNLCQIN